MAIAIAVLILNVRVDRGDVTAHALLRALGHECAYLGFITAFVMIAITRLGGTPTAEPIRV